MPEAYLNSGPTLFFSSHSAPPRGSPQPHPYHSPSPRDVDKKPHLLEDVLLIEESAVLWRENTHGGLLEPYSYRVPSNSPGPKEEECLLLHFWPSPEATANSSRSRRCLQKLLIHPLPTPIGPRTEIYTWGVGLGSTFVGAQQRGTWSHRWPQ